MWGEGGEVYKKSSKPISDLFLKKHCPGFIMICGTIWMGLLKKVKSVCGIEAVCMCFNDSDLGW